MVKMADGCLTLEELHPILMTGGIIRAADKARTDGWTDWISLVCAGEEHNLRSVILWP